MHNPPDPGSSHIQPQHPNPPPADMFFTATKFPNLGNFPESAPPPLPQPASRPLSTRLILPMILFILAIAGIAWVVQQLPNWRAPGRTDPRNSKGKDPRNNPSKDQTDIPPMIGFFETRSLWDPADPAYAKEFERGTKGHYDFPFKSLTDKPAEVGLLRTSCGCSKVEITIVDESQWEKLEKEYKAGSDPFTWQAVKADEWKGLVLSPRQRGLVRLSWDGRKTDGTRLRLTADLWAQPKDETRSRLYVSLETLVALVPPVQFVQDRIPFEGLSANQTIKKEFLCWSSTRPAMNLAVAEPNDPLFVSQAQPLTREEAGNLEKQLRQKENNTRVLSAFRVTVTLHEQKDGKQMDLGAFERTVPLLLDGQPLETPGPVIHGTVQSEVQVGGPEDRGRINLQTFQARDGVQKKVPMWVPKGMKLEIASQNPLYVSAKLVENPKESTANKTRWTLEITIPPGNPAGFLPQDSVINLRLQGTTTRLIRIPLTGNAIQG